MPHKPKKPKAPPRDYAAEWAAQKAKDERQAQTKASARAKADEDLIDEQMRRAAMNRLRAEAAAQEKADRHERKVAAERAARGIRPPPPAITATRHLYLVALGLTAAQNSEAFIKKAYHSLALKYHPDKNSDPAAPARMQAINAAYEALMKD